MKKALLTSLMVLCVASAFACIDQTFINNDNYESTKHPFELEWNEGYLMVILADQMPEGCGKYQRSRVGNNEGPLEEFKAEDSKYSHSYFFFDHQLKEKKLVVAGWYDCDGCNGNTKIYILELDKIDKIESANKSVDTIRVSARRNFDTPDTLNLNPTFEH